MTLPPAMRPVGLLSLGKSRVQFRRQLFLDRHRRSKPARRRLPGPFALVTYSVSRARSRRPLFERTRADFGLYSLVNLPELPSAGSLAGAEVLRRVEAMPRRLPWQTQRASGQQPLMERKRGAKGGRGATGKVRPARSHRRGQARPRPRADRRTRPRTRRPAARLQRVSERGRRSPRR